MKELGLRSITGALIVFAIIGSIILNKHVFAILFLVITVFGTYEFYKMLTLTKYRAQVNFGTVISGILYSIMSLIALGYLNPLYLSLVIVLFFIIPIRELYRDSKCPIANISLTIFGIIYVGLTFGMLNFLFYHGFEGKETFHFII